ncbi:MAG: hypothetical protein H6Q65_1292 [Firmicutes bacterium]|nr:hypothetical protein [Bacillota bacterium]
MNTKMTLAVKRLPPEARKILDFMVLNFEFHETVNFFPRETLARVAGCQLEEVTKHVRKIASLERKYNDEHGSKMTVEGLKRGDGGGDNIGFWINHSFYEEYTGTTDLASAIFSAISADVTANEELDEKILNEITAITNECLNHMTPERARIMHFLISVCDVDNRKYLFSRKELSEVAGCGLADIENIVKGIIGPHNIIEYQFPNGDWVNYCMVEAIKFFPDSIRFTLSTEFRKVVCRKSPEKLQKELG